MRALAITAAIAVVASTLLALSPQPTAVAANGANFNPGNIISDANFYNANAMTQAQIQSFLEAQEPGACGPNSCLKNYRMTTPNKAQYYSDSSGRVECQAYTGAANELASTIIFRVQQVCGISAKVILVTLQKERGLVTKTHPSAADFTVAMGFGCPDSAACNTDYYGLFNQIRKAAEQFKRYRVAPGDFNYRAGRVNHIQYKPFTNCGTLPVYIENQATAGLYNYTPYVPNAAALNNLYGTGDACSSYGNRNFFAYYSDWFGAATGSGSDQIAALYESQGGAGGPLGAATGSIEALHTYSGGLRQVFQGGAIYWTSASGAVIVSGAILAAYDSVSNVNGSLGWPTAPATDVSAGGAGKRQAFQFGTIYSTPAATAYAIIGPLSELYNSTGGPSGKLGWPTGAGIYDPANGSGTHQQFQNGTIFWSARSGAHIVSASLLNAYSALGGPSGKLGWPLSGQYDLSVNGGGKSQGFQGGSMYESAAGAFAVSGAIRNAYWSALGEGGYLGWPTGTEACEPDSSCSQTFQSGTIVLAGGSAEILPKSSPEIDAVYKSLGGASGVLGKVQSGVFLVDANGGGKAQGFQGGSIYWSAATGGFAVTGSIRNAYWSALGEGGYMGWPTSAATAVSSGGGGTVQSFQGGAIYKSASGTRIVSGAILAAYKAAGAEGGTMGWPLSEQYELSVNGGGTAQGFQGGSIYGSAAGAFAVTGAIRNAYWAEAGEGGFLGWPTSAETCAADGVCTQTFQNANIVSASSGTRLQSKSPEIDAVYVGLGGPSGALGSIQSPVYDVAANGGGKAQGFRGGSIYWSPANGGFAVSGAIRNAYWGALGEGGFVGWPTGPQVCAGGTCSQTFENANIVSTGATARLQSKSLEIDAVHLSLGGPSGPVGAVASRVFDVAANGGGKAQGFTNASVYWSAASGGFAVAGEIRAAYWSVLGEGGPLGWPTAAQVCGPPSVGCSQSFQHGTISWSSSEGARVTQF